MLTDPLEGRPATVVSSAASSETWARTHTRGDFNEYNAEPATAAGIRYTSSLRVANYPNGSEEKRRAVISFQVSRYDETNAVDLSPFAVSMSLTYEKSGQDDPIFLDYPNRLANMLSSISGDSVLTRLINGEK